MSAVEVVSSHNFDDKEQKPFTAVPFGKYIGIPFKELVQLTELKNGRVIEKGKNYLKWLYAQDWIKPELKVAIESYVK